MVTIARRWLAALMVLCAVLLGLAIGGGEASAARVGPLGANEMGRWCNASSGTAVLFHAGPWNLWSAYSWTCLTPVNTPTKSVDYGAACRYLYGPSAFAQTSNRNWAHSWECRR